jgi:hypothetical protein
MFRITGFRVESGNADGSKTFGAITRDKYQVKLVIKLNGTCWAPQFVAAPD